MKLPPNAAMHPKDVISPLLSLAADCGVQRLQRTQLCQLVQKRHDLHVDRGIVRVVGR